ncbi:hypothetical protein [Rhodocyclus tenuis]|uniref:HK97 gp10 family phage protein n=1 Tax=Rhodocyclus tenuis TaxID=1066 RepID=A0A840G938_RHOTE|nr:hypothetical protein [Rhodocyclus tenuis]MBB4248385.1 hypothetical protein [Rhodocyclus tenuis]
MVEPVTLAGFAEVEALWAKAPEIAREEFRALIFKGVNAMEEDAKNLVPTNHGSLRASIYHEVREFAVGLGVEGVTGTASNYAIPVELGSKPHTPPIAPLIDWAQQKFGLEEKEAEGVAFAVAYRIAQRGTLGVGMFHRAFAANRGALEAGSRVAAKRIVARMTAISGKPS